MHPKNKNKVLSGSIIMLASTETNSQPYSSTNIVAKLGFQIPSIDRHNDYTNTEMKSLIDYYVEKMNKMNKMK